MATQTDPGKDAMKAATPKGRGRQKSEDAAYKIAFLNEKNEESGRIPTVVVGIKVTSLLDNKATVISLKDIPSAVLAQYAADGLRKKSNFFLKDVKKTEASKVHSLTNELLTASKNATIFVPKEGGGPGRAFDFDFWVDVMAKTAEIKHKAGHPKAKLMTDKVKADFRKKLESMTPAERNEKKKKWESDRAFKNAAKLVQAERVQKNIANEDFTDEYDALADM